MIRSINLVFMKKILILIVVLLGVVLYWKSVQSRKAIINENTDIYEVFSNSLPSEKPEAEDIFDYSSETSNDKINFKIGNVIFDLNRYEDYKTKLVIKLDKKVLLEENFNAYVTNILNLKWKGKMVSLISFYWGGAHCCTYTVPFLVDNDKIVRGDAMFQGNAGSLVKDSFFVKDDKLYAYKSDDRFSYFEMDYAASSNTMRFPYFAEMTIDPLGFVERNSQFKQIYNDLYKVSQKNAKTLLTSDYCKQTDDYKKYEGLGNIINRYTLGYLSGIDREKLKNELKKDWSCFPGNNFESIENDIFNKLQDGDQSLVSTDAKNKITDLVNKFENKIKDRDRSIINMFSLPESDQEKKTLAFLKEDLGLGEMRVFSIALFSYKLLDFRVNNMMPTGNLIQVSVTETRNNYDNSKGKWYETTQDYTLEVTKVDSAYLIKNYFLKDTEETKYEGLYLN